MVDGYAGLRFQGGRYDVNPKDQTLLHGAGGWILFDVSRSRTCLSSLLQEVAVYDENGA